MMRLYLSPELIPGYSVNVCLNTPRLHPIITFLRPERLSRFPSDLDSSSPEVIETLPLTKAESRAAGDDTEIVENIWPDLSEKKSPK
jgi:hypothetical protein